MAIYNYGTVRGWVLFVIWVASNGRQKRRLTNFNVENQTAMNRADFKSIVFIILDWVASPPGARVGGECDPLGEIHTNVETNREA